MEGYLGKILRVDLSAGKIWDEPLREDYVRDYIGGSGLAARYLYDLVNESTDPLGPDNPLIFMTGPLVGTTMPSAGRYCISAISPLTKIFGESNSGGFFGPELRFAGYDGMIITGQSAQPVWLSIIAGKAELHDASDIWGNDSYVTQTLVKEILGEPKARVACIGQAGENMVSLAAVMNDHGRAAGRTGMGAVMGAKRLKAIAVRGAAPIPLADPARFKQTIREINVALKEDIAAEALRMAGTAGYVNMALMYGDLPVRYYQQGEWEEGENLSGVLMVVNYQNRNTGCYKCPIACGRETRSPAYAAAKVDGPEYETLGALGSLVMVADLETVIYAGHLCNQYGLDTISTGSTIALACELFERGLMNQADTGGIEIRYGDGPLLVRLVEMLALREGFGELLAEGSAALAERFGVPELAVTVNRLEVPMHDPRAFSGLTVSYLLSPRGACHMQGDMYSVDTGQSGELDLGILPGDRLDSSEEKGRIAARQQIWRNLYNSMILCQFQNPGVNRLLEVLNSATGWELDSAGLMKQGKKIINLKRLLNFRLGMRRDSERLPALLQKPLPGGTEGNVPNVEALLAGAYAEYNWDPITGLPDPDSII